MARDYSLLRGWNSSYPETTGYIVPTFLDCARRSGDETLRDRARRMLDWLAATQFPEGGIVGGMIDSTPRVPVTFNTGQVLIGLAAGVRELGESYREPMNRAATWLRDTLDADGCWRRYPTPFAAAGEKAYETHVSWGLFDHLHRRIVSGCQRFHDPAPNACPSPTDEAVVAGRRRSIVLRQITPRRT